MLLAYFLAVARIAYRPWLRFGGYLADAVFADEVGPAAVRCVAEEPLAAEDAAALLGDVRIQSE
jgi:hypothetical protein